MKESIEQLMRKPWFAHLMAAVGRFGKRLGPQFAGSVTYFSVLSMIPVLLFAVALLGFTVTVLRPDLLREVQNILQEQLGATAGSSGAGDDDPENLANTISDFVTDTFQGWRSVTLIAFLAAAYSGSNWVKNLKHAVRAMWMDSFAEAAKTGPFLKEVLGNLIIFFGLLLSVAIAVGVTAAGQAFPEEIIKWLGAGDVPGINALLQVSSLIVSLLASWLLFAFLFIVLPGERTQSATFFKATIAGAVLVTILQRLAGELVGALSGNRSAGIFGPIIILMIVFNVLAMIILMIAAWVGTADSWEGERAVREAEEAAGVAPHDETEIDDEPRNGLPALSPPTLAARRRAERWAARLDSDSLRVVNYDPASISTKDPEGHVKQGVAARSVRVGMGLGYGVGAATGIGLGAVIAAMVSRIARR